MTEQQFAALTRAYGSNKQRWPAEHHALFAQHADTPYGQALLAEAEWLDRLLADMPEPMPPSGDFQVRIHAVTGQDIATEPAAMPAWQLRLATLPLIASLCLGLLIGFNSGQDQARQRLALKQLGQLTIGTPGIAGGF